MKTFILLKKNPNNHVIPIQHFLNASKVSAINKLLCYIHVGDTPLHECVKNGMLSCIQALLRKGSDVNHKNLQGFSPLHIAVRAGEKFSMEILRELVTRGYSTDVNIPESLGILLKNIYQSLYIYNIQNKAFHLLLMTFLL